MRAWGANRPDSLDIARRGYSVPVLIANLSILSIRILSKPFLASKFTREISHLPYNRLQDEGIFFDDEHKTFVNP